MLVMLLLGQSNVVFMHGYLGLKILSRGFDELYAVHLQTQHRDTCCCGKHHAKDITLVNIEEMLDSNSGLLSLGL